MLQLTCKSLMVPRVGYVGKNLCWAEVGFILGRFYNSQNGTFCRYLSALSGGANCCDLQNNVNSCCDVAGYLADALAAVRVVPTRLGADWAAVRSELNSGRPLVLEKKGKVGHAFVVVGYLDQNGLRGVELIDPSGQDWRQLYLWQFYADQLSLPRYVQFKTALEASSNSSLQPVPIPLPVVLNDSFWPTENLQASRFDQILVLEVPDQVYLAINAFVARFGGHVDRNQLAVFPLKILAVHDAELPSQIEFLGYRCFLSQSSGGSQLVVDVVRQADGRYEVAKILAGDLVNERIVQLKHTLRNNLLAAHDLQFEEWVDLGLDLFFYKKPGLQSPKVRLFGSRSYGNMDLESNLEASAGEFILDSKSYLQSLPPR